VSRASDLRDAVITELDTRLTGQTVEAFIVPHYTREELTSGPKIAVRIAERELEIDMGPDTRNIIIEIGVVGVTPALTGSVSSAHRSQEVAACDVFDGLMEEIIALWSPNGVLSKRTAGLSGHRFIGIEQPIMFDPQKLYSDGIWLSLIRLTYQDTTDD
jgi:hypothetical protein